MYILALTYITLMYSSSMELSGVNTSDAICSLVESGSWVLRLINSNNRRLFANYGDCNLMISARMQYLNTSLWSNTKM